MAIPSFFKLAFPAERSKLRLRWPPEPGIYLTGKHSNYERQKWKSLNFPSYYRQLEFFCERDLTPDKWKEICSMSFAFRASLCFLALSFNFVSLALAQAPPDLKAPAAKHSDDESSLRALAEAFFSGWAARDLDGFLRLWSAQSPELEARRKETQELFARSERIELRGLAIRAVKMDGDQARVRLEVDALVIEAGTGKEKAGYGKMMRELRCVKEAGAWKVWREASAYDELAAALAAAKSDQEREALLAEEKDLASAELSQALHAKARRQGSYPQALTIFRLAQRVGEQVGAQLEVGNALMGIGYVYSSQGDYAKALEHLQQCMAILEPLGNKAGVGRALNNIGNVHRYQGDYAMALEYYGKSLTISESLGNKSGTADALGNIGVVYSIQGNLARALYYYKKSLAVDEAAGDKLGIAINLGNIGVIHRKQGAYEQALEHYRKSQAVSEAIGDKIGIAQMLNNIGVVHRFKDDYAQALEHYRKSLAIREELGDNRGIASALHAIGTVHELQGDYARALEHYQKGLSMDEAMGDKDGIASALHTIGVVHRKQGRYSEALDFAERATTIARQIGAFDVLWETRLNAGSAYRALNQSDRARLSFDEAIAVIEAMRAQVAGGEREQQGFFENKLSPYHAMVDLLVARNSPTEALTFAERAKARALLDMLYSGRVNIVKAMTGQEQERERTLRAELISLNMQVARANQQDKPDQAGVGELKSLREKARLNYEAFQTSLYAAHPELKVQRGEAQVIKAEEIAELAPDAGSALLEYVVMDNVTYLFTVTKDVGTAKAEVRAYTLPVKRDDLSKQTETFRRQLAARDLGFRGSAANLYALLIKPAEAQLRGKTSIVIAPDGKLWDLPFQALLSGPQRFLIEDAAISYTPSLTALREMMKRRKNQDANPAPATLLALGNPKLGQETLDGAALALRGEKLDPLPEAEQEVKALRRLYGVSQSKVYVGAEAREDRVKNEAGKAAILHFATHGILNDASPMYSHLALAHGDTNEDGLLEAWELMQLDLKADLVALSACETARGRFGAGEGMIGLTWALFVAGAPSAVVSQWKVESASARDLMLGFHRQLRAPAKGGVTKAEALRRAALNVMKNSETRHPFYWAGFVLVGAS
jgi:CHAT domain-containing protein